MGQSKNERMLELVELLNKASRSYYQDAQEIMSNYEYDRLYDELQNLEKELGITLSNSPTVNVGYEVVSELPKERHESPMLSLDKTKEVEELKNFVGSQKVLMSWKMDGLTIVTWKAEVKKLAAKIEEECGVKITPERLKAAIHAVNEKRRALQRLAATRAADPAPISGLDSLLTVQAAFMDDTPRLTGAINDMAAECEERAANGEGVAPKGTKRILYTGTPMAVPNWKLFNLIEKAGGVVVGEESCTGSRYYKDLVDESGETVNEMLDAIAERYFKINCAVFTPNDQRMKDIVQMARDLHADGIVDVALQFCTLYEMESFAVEKAAEEAGIPFMHITTDYAGEDAGQLQTRIEAFLETI